MLGEPKHVSSAILKHSFDRRSLLIGGLQTGLGVLLAARLGWIGLVQNSKYSTMSESNRVNLTLIPPRRGRSSIATTTSSPRTGSNSAST